MNCTLSDIATRFASAKSVLITSHDRPDADALGSVLALGRLLKKQGKEVVMVNRDLVPDSLAFLPEADRIEKPGVTRPFDLFAVLDSAAPERVDACVWKMGEQAATTINLDHHISNTHFGDLVHVAPDSPATGVLIWRLAEVAGWSLDTAIAENLMAAISTDTGGFRYPSTTAETLRIAASLIEQGIDWGRMNEQLYDTTPLRGIVASQVLLERLRLDFAGRCASVSVPYSLTRRLGLQPGDTDSLVNTLRSIDTVNIAVLFEELPNGMIRISSRGKSGFAVGPICARFGGGGHALAAGARIAAPLAEAEARFLAAVKESLMGETE